MLPVETPFKIYTGLDGKPLDNGYVYFGLPNQDPIAHPVTVYWDAAGTLPAEQPLRTVSGYIMNAGTPANVFFDGAYSELVKNSKGQQVFYAQTSDSFSIATVVSAFLTNIAEAAGSALMGFTQGVAGAVTRTVQSKLRDTVSVKDFGAKGDYDSASGTGTDDTAAINAAIAYAKLGGARCVLVPPGNYKTSASINVGGNFDAGIEFRGEGATITCTAAVSIIDINCRVPDSPPQVRINAYVHGLNLVGPGTANVLAVGIKAQRGAGVRVERCAISSVYRGIYGFGNLISHYSDIQITGTFIPLHFEPDGIEFAPNDIHFTRIKAFDNERSCRMLSFPNGSMTFIGCEFEGNNLSGSLADGVRVAEFFNAGKVTMIGCHMEDNPGQYNLFFDGPAKSHLNIIGCEIIPGDSCGNVLYMTNASGVANLYVEGSRVTNNVGSSQIVLAGANPALVIGGTSGNFSGTLSNLVLIRDGKIGMGGSVSTFAPFRGKSTAGIGYDCEGMFRYVDASENRLGYASASGIRVDANTQWSVGCNNIADLVLRRLGTLTVEAGADNTYSLGSGGVRWGTVYAGTATINTSDERTKQQIRPIDAAALRAWANVEYCQFKFNDAVVAKGDGARWHFGVIAQRVKEAFESEGLDAFAYGLLCYDEWEDNYTDELDGIGQPTGEKVLQVAAGNRYGIRYEEALALECAYLRSRLGV